jgi:hypothetical protein
MIPARAHLGSGVGTSSMGQLRAAQTGARSPPATKPIPAIAARGLAAKASPTRPSKSAMAACVVPQVGQGRPVMARNGQAGTNGASASQSGRSSSEHTVTAPHNNASCRSSRFGLRQPTVAAYRVRWPIAAASAAPKAATRIATHTQHSASGNSTASADLPWVVR